MQYRSREARLMLALKYFFENKDQHGAALPDNRKHGLASGEVPLSAAYISAVMPPILAPLAASIQPATARLEDGTVSFAPLVHLIKVLTFEEACVLDLLELGHDAMNELRDRSSLLCDGVKLGRIYEAEIVTTASIETPGAAIPPRHILTLSIEPRWIER